MLTLCENLLSCPQLHDATDQTKKKNKTMKIELFETTTDEQGLLTGRRSISHIKGARAESIGLWELPQGVTLGETNYDEPGLFSGNNLMYPEWMKKTIVLKAGIDSTERAAWIYLKKA